MIGIKKPVASLGASSLKAPQYQTLRNEDLLKRDHDVRWQAVYQFIDENRWVRNTVQSFL